MRLGDLDALKKSMCELCNQYYSDEPCEPSDCVFLNAIEKLPPSPPCLWLGAEIAKDLCHIPPSTKKK